MSGEEETFRRLVVELRMLEGTADALQSRVNLVNAALNELRVAGMTLGGLEKERKNAQLFVPIGGGSYIKAKLESADRLIVGMGAGVASERKMKKGKENLKSRAAELEKTRTTLRQQLTQVVEKIRESRSKLQDLATKMRKEESTPKGWIFMVGADSDRLAVENSSWTNGAFTHTLLEALSGKADGFESVGQRDGTVTMGELRAYLNSAMPDETQRILGVAKRPVITTSTGDPGIWRRVHRHRSGDRTGL